MIKLGCGVVCVQVLVFVRTWEEMKQVALIHLIFAFSPTKKSQKL